MERFHEMISVVTTLIKKFCAQHIYNQGMHQKEGQLRVRPLERDV